MSLLICIECVYYSVWLYNAVCDMCIAYPKDGRSILLSLIWCTALDSVGYMFLLLQLCGSINSLNWIELLDENVTWTETTNTLYNYKTCFNLFNPVIWLIWVTIKLFKCSSNPMVFSYGAGLPCLGVSDPPGTAWSHMKPRQGNGSGWINMKGFLVIWVWVRMNELEDFICI